MDTSVDPKGAPESLGAGRAMILWLLFFLISFGLGYPTLNRFDSRKLGPDEEGYYNIVVNQEAPDDVPFCFRVLVPEVAKPFYLLAKGRVGSWNPVSFGLLISNSLFCATSTFLLLLVGLRVLRDLPLALLGCTLYLLNFVVPNLWLAGMVDSSEACLMMAITWALFSGRWWLLPLIGIPGGLAKQTFPAVLNFVCDDVVVCGQESDQDIRTAPFGGGSRSRQRGVGRSHLPSNCGIIQTPWAMATLWDSRENFAQNILKGFLDREFWYAFVWLLPLGVWRTCLGFRSPG